MTKKRHSKGDDPKGHKKKKVIKKESKKHDKEKTNHEFVRIPLDKKKEKVIVEESRKDEEEMEIEFLDDEEEVLEPKNVDSENKNKTEDFMKKKDKKKQEGSKHEMKLDPIDESKIDDQITEIYENEDGSMPDMKEFKKKPRRHIVRALLVLFFSVGSLVAVTWIGFFVIAPQANFSEEDVILTISGDESAVIGEQIRYRVRYRNAQSTPLTKTLIQVRYPAGFVFESSSKPPNNDRGDEWALPNLVADESGYIDIFGRMYGNVGEAQSFRAFFNYTPQNFSSEFQKVDTARVELASIPLDFILDGPDDVVLGGNASFRVVVDNLGKEALKNLAVQVDGQGIFTTKESNPIPDKFFEDRWSIEQLTDEMTIDILGTITASAEDGTGEIKFSLVGWKDSLREADPYVYVEKIHQFNFLETNLSANLVVNGTTKSLTVQPGEILNSSIILRNAGDIELKNVVVRAIFDAPSFDRNSLLKWQDLEEGFNANISGEQLNSDRRRGVITWNRSNINDLRQLDPKEELIIDLSLPLKTPSDIDLSKFPNGSIEAILEVEYELEGEKKIYSSNPIAMIVNSDVSFEVRHEGNTKTGKGEHTYNWIINNTLHELTDLKVEVDLYGEVDFATTTANIPAGKLSYDNDSQKLTWLVESMPVGVDILALQFETNVIMVNDAQTNLTSKVSFEAKDSISEQVIRKVGDEILLGE
jgi:hypothetical protein